MKQPCFLKNPTIDKLLTQERFEEALHQPIGNPVDPIASVFSNRPVEAGKGVALYGGLTLGDFLYDYIRIDPTVVEGIDFVRADDLRSILSFSRFAEQHAELTGSALQRSVSQLQGYVAEQFVAQHYIAQGHDVTFPETPNQEGWDLLIDGERMQVKNLASPGGILAHLEKHPNIPIITNAELADKLADNPNVYIDPALHYDEVIGATKDTLAQGAELADFEIPWISLAVSSATNLREWVNHNTDVQGLFTNIATDAVGRSIFGGVGKYAGAALGSMFFGPAGFIVVGGVGAVVGGGYIGKVAAQKAREILVVSERDALRKQCALLAKEAATAGVSKNKAWTTKRIEVEHRLAGGPKNRVALRTYMTERMDRHKIYFDNKGLELEQVVSNKSDDPFELVVHTLKLIQRAGIHPHRIQDQLRNLGELTRELARKLKKYRLHS